MELRIPREELLKGLQRTAGIVEKRTSMPILSHLLIQAKDKKITLYATDLELGYEGSYSGEIIKEGSITLPAKKLYEIVRELFSKEVYLYEMENHRVFLSGGGAEFQIGGLPPEDFPALPPYQNITTLSFSQADFMELIEKTIFSVSQEETHYKLSGIYFEKIPAENKLRLVSTDGHRLSLVEKEIQNLDTWGFEEGIIIPRKAVQEMYRMVEDKEKIEIGFKDKFGLARCGEHTLVIRLLEGKFPEYQAVLPTQQDKKVLVFKDKLKETVRRISIISPDRFFSVKLAFSPNKLQVLSINPDIGEAKEELEVEYSGPELEIVFNARYILDVLSAMKSEKVLMELKDFESGCVLKGEEDPGFLAVIMPMQN